MKYRIDFIARKLGAIGTFQYNVEIVEAENKDEAIKKLYENYDLYMYPSNNHVQEIKEK